MRTVVLGPRPPELDAMIARRHALGLDGHETRNLADGIAWPPAPAGGQAT